MSLIITLIAVDKIVVITPYHAQKMKILQLFAREGRLNGIEVGSVEEFQGQVIHDYYFYRNITN
jgi:superfamily I DNA and/or RNA helicase